MNTENLHFAFVEMKYMAKNSFQEEILKRVEEFNRLLVVSPDEFQNSLYFMVSAVHDLFPRCKMLTVSDYSGVSNDRSIKIESNQGILVSISVRKINGLWPVKP